ncbi:receptor-transporting protein 2-like [Oncorhynchus keta]|uniref:receptor-transporting protein 2-like n=1 Tax=Oncorhynchus keta TaxID=8018 RepID=UPI0015F7E16B|nr:receptor-transporting protein 2-like [Oncorhynchus keta]XP_052331381.1 receptor-transporting protein 2-like [Oncorhynchus keta]
MTNQEWIRIFQSKVNNLKRNKRDRWRIEFDDSIKADNVQFGWHQYISGAFGRFKCSKCNRSWSSGRVNVVFHMHLSSGQGMVKVRCLRQECRQCDGALMEEASFDEEKLEVLLEKLMEKIRVKCYRENLGKRNRRDFDDEDDEGPPHESAHCEACSMGLCTKRFKAW